MCYFFFFFAAFFAGFFAIVHLSIELNHWDPMGGL